MSTIHKAVLLKEVVDYLVRPFWGSRFLPSNPPPSANWRSGWNRGGTLPQTDSIKNSVYPWFLDGTLGGAGHSLAIADAFAGKLNIIGIDRDAQAIERAKHSLQGKVNDGCKM